MSQQLNMNAFLHSLLVIQEMNDFTVVEARNALIAEHADFTDSTEARKYIYRQLLWGIKNNLLKRTDLVKGGKKEVVYSKTDTFFASTFVPTKHRNSSKKNHSHKVVPAKPSSELNSYKEVLEKELMTYEIDLTASLEEAEEYKRLSARFPELKEKLQQHQLQVKNQSTQLLGRVHALQKLLGYTITGYQSC